MKEKKINFKKLLSRSQWFSVVGAFFFFLLLLAYTFFSGNHYEGASPIRIQINKGESLSEITNDLYKNKIIPSKFNFRIASFILAAEKRIKAGRYYIQSGLSYIDLVEKFVDGDGDLLKEVSLYDGITVNGCKNKFSKTVDVNGSEFTSLVKDKQLINKLGIKASSFEGYLLPGEYDIYDKSSAKEVIETCYKRFQLFFNDSLKQRAAKLGYSVHEVITMASIVQGETKKEDEMPVIAGVYYNRLKIGMRLQADPTVEYLQENGWKRLSVNDLKTDSPYNTYRYKGLPPGPINNPGKKAILAALYPKHHDYLFFVANGKGSHNFSKNFTDHILLANEYRKKLDSKN